MGKKRCFKCLKLLHLIRIVVQPFILCCFHAAFSHLSAVLGSLSHSENTNVARHLSRTYKNYCSLSIVEVFLRNDANDVNAQVLKFFRACVSGKLVGYRGVFIGLLVSEANEANEVFESAIIYESAVVDEALEVIEVIEVKKVTEANEANEAHAVVAGKLNVVNEANEVRGLKRWVWRSGRYLPVVTDSLPSFPSDWLFSDWFPSDWLAMSSVFGLLCHSS